MFDNEKKNSINRQYELSEKHFIRYIPEINKKIQLLTEDEALCMKFIYGNLPLTDTGDYEFETYLSFVKHSLFARETMPWGKMVPTDLFLSHVLFPRIFDEKIEDHRKILFDIFYPSILGIEDMDKAVLKLNYEALAYGTYKMPSRRALSPLSFLNRTFGRCGEESVFMAAVLRSMCIPARQIYSVAWAHCDDRHAWVEAWCDGKWHYLGACEPEPHLDKGWFDAAASRGMMIQYREFDSTKNYQDKITGEGPSVSVSRTKAYGEEIKLTIAVLKNGVPLVNAKVSIEIINYGSFNPICLSYTDKKGEVSVFTGKADLNIRVVQDGYFTERLINTGEVNHIEIDFSKACKEEKEGMYPFEMTAPADLGKNSKGLTSEEIKIHKESLAEKNKSRTEREEKGTADLSGYTNKEEFIHEEKLAEMLSNAKLNGGEVLKFLNGADSKYSFMLLETLDVKDFVDIKADILQSHLEKSIGFAGTCEETAFKQYILAPRISYEEITPYKKDIESYFSDEKKREFAKNPAKAWEYIDENIKCTEEKYFPYIIPSCKTMLMFKEGSAESKYILFVAIMRTLGICARLNPNTKAPEFMQDGRFISPLQEYNDTGKIKINPQEGVNWIYGSNWTVARLKNGVYETYSFSGKPEDMEKEDFPAGTYRLITVNRLPKGDTHNIKYIFKVEKGCTKEVDIKISPINFEEMWLNIPLRDFSLSYEGSNILVSKLFKEGKNLALWLGEGEEPTEHVLNEIAELKDIFNLTDVNIMFICRNENAFKNKNIQRVLQFIPKIKKCVDRDFYMHEPVARGLYTDHSKLPFIVITNDGLNAVYAFGGYNVGIGDMVLKFLVH